MIQWMLAIWSLVPLSGKELTCQCRRLKRCRFHPWIEKVPWRRAQQPTSVFLPVESWTEEPGRLQSIGSYRVGHDWSNLAHTHAVSRQEPTELNYLLAVLLEQISWTFLVVQCIRICLPMQETRIRSLVSGKISHATEQLRPHTTISEPTALTTDAWVPGSCVHKERDRCNEKPSHHRQ